MCIRDRYQGAPVVVEKGGENTRPGSGNVLIPVADSINKAGFKAEIESHIGASSGVCILDLRPGPATIECPFTIQQFGNRDSATAVRTLREIFEEGIDTQGKIIQVIVPDSLVTVEALRELSTSLRTRDAPIVVPSFTTTPAPSSGVRPIGDKPERAKTDRLIQELRAGKRVVPSTSRSYVETVCRASASRYRHTDPELSWVTIMRTSKTKQGHDQQKLSSTEPDWGTVLKGDVIDCRPGLAPGELPKGIQCIDGRDYESLVALVRAVATARSGKTTKHITLILPEEDWGDNVWKTVAPEKQVTPTPLPGKMARLWKWGKSWVDTATDTVVDAMESAPQRIRFSEGLVRI